MSVRSHLKVEARGLKFGQEETYRWVSWSQSVFVSAAVDSKKERSCSSWNDRGCKSWDQVTWKVKVPVLSVPSTSWVKHLQLVWFSAPRESAGCFTAGWRSCCFSRQERCAARMTENCRHWIERHHLLVSALQFHVWVSFKAGRYPHCSHRLYDTPQIPAN